MHVLGRRHGDGDGPVASLGHYRARDGSDGAAIGLDLDCPHAGLVVGKRGSGKSYTLGVLAEELARADGVTPVVVDPMSVFDGLAANSDGEPVSARVIDEPTVRASSVTPAAWPELLGLDPSSPAGSLVWRIASDASTLAAMRAGAARADAPESTRRTAENHLRTAASWGVFGPDGVDAANLVGGTATILDLSGHGPDPMAAIVAGVTRELYDACVSGAVECFPWLLIDEAHAFFEGAAASALRTLLTRGRAPGVSLVAATQRPCALPEVAVAQADLLVAHRLTAAADVDALTATRPTYLAGSIRERLPSERGCALVIDDATESVNHVRVRRRDTPHGGDSPRASDGREPAENR